jgi:hypothetical protein
VLAIVCELAQPIEPTSAVLCVESGPRPLNLQ